MCVCVSMFICTNDCKSLYSNRLVNLRMSSPWSSLWPVCHSDPISFSISLFPFHLYQPVKADCCPPESGSAQGFFQSLLHASSGVTSWFLFDCAKSFEEPFHSSFLNKSWLTDSLIDWWTCDEDNGNSAIDTVHLTGVVLLLLVLLLILILLYTTLVACPVLSCKNTNV